MTRRTHDVADSPLGPLTLVADDGVLSGLYMTEQRHRPGESSFGERDPLAFEQVTEQLKAYFEGELTRFEIPLVLTGTPFRQRVWAALQEIPFGSVLSYGQLADRLGQPGASRAVGLANGRNPVGIIVPCHRVVGSDGSLTGYGGGVGRKQYLLNLERGLLSHT
jgi:methylated-DNA-[protein]-cysteine S-methyltransferase